MVSRVCVVFLAFLAMDSSWAHMSSLASSEPGSRVPNPHNTTQQTPFDVIETAMLVALAMFEGIRFVFTLLLHIYEDPKWLTFKLGFTPIVWILSLLIPLIISIYVLPSLLMMYRAAPMNHSIRQGGLVGVVITTTLFRTWFLGQPLSLLYKWRILRADDMKLSTKEFFYFLGLSLGHEYLPSMLLKYIVAPGTASGEMKEFLLKAHLNLLSFATTGADIPDKLLEDMSDHEIFALIDALEQYCDDHVPNATPNTRDLEEGAIAETTCRAQGAIRFRIFMARARLLRKTKMLNVHEATSRAELFESEASTEPFGATWRSNWIVRLIYMVLSFLNAIIFFLIVMTYLVLAGFELLYELLLPVLMAINWSAVIPKLPAYIPESLVKYQNVVPKSGGSLLQASNPNSNSPMTLFATLMAKLLKPIMDRINAVQTGVLSNEGDPALSELFSAARETEIRKEMAALANATAPPPTPETNTTQAPEPEPVLEPDTPETSLTADVIRLPVTQAPAPLPVVAADRAVLRRSAPQPVPELSNADRSVNVFSLEDAPSSIGDPDVHVSLGMA